jgi:transcriptional regulator with XRE-family HTH domain
MLEIRRLRKSRGWNQTELAFYASLAPSVISQVENGKRDPSASTLRKLAKALEVEVGDLFPKAQAPLPLDDAIGRVPGITDPVQAAGFIQGIKDAAAGISGVWNQDVELYELYGREIQPYRSLEMSSVLITLQQHFFSALAILQSHAREIGADPDVTTWDVPSKRTLIEAGASLATLYELRKVIARSTENKVLDKEDFRALRQEFDMSALSFLEEDPLWPEEMERARAVAGLVS